MRCGSFVSARLITTNAIWPGSRYSSPLARVMILHPGG